MLNSYSNNIVYLSGEKNPFDRQFEFAFKNRVTSTSNSFNPSSPLNTPLIAPDSALNSAAVPDLSLSDPSPAITTAQITNLILETELAKEAELNEANNASNIVINDADENKIDKINDSIIDNDSNFVGNNKTRHRSNVVSVICPPVPTIRDEKIRSAPVITSNINDLTNENKKESKTDNKPHLDNHLTTSIVPCSGAINESIIDSKESSLLNDGSSKAEVISTLPVAINLNYTASYQETYSTYKKILPKHDLDANSDNIVQQLSNLPPVRRKEKTLDELISKIKATEAALPPKAKPGRKSKQATEEDAKEKKRLSLERNRAAAMRCRLKKKKEINELKNKVKNYEQQNLQLKVRSIENFFNPIIVNCNFPFSRK